MPDTIIFDIMFENMPEQNEDMSILESNIINQLNNLLKEREKISQYITSLPQIAAQLLIELENKETDFIKIESILNKDPILAAKVLSIVNSAYYKHTSQPITHLLKAISILGLDCIISILMPVLLKGVFNINLYHFKLFGSIIWQHSLETAVLCQTLGKDQKKISQFHCYLMGLVHDLGKVVAFQCISQNLTEAKGTPNIGSDSFKQALSQCSLALSIQTAILWQLPKEVIESLELQLTNDTNNLASILHLANKISEANLMIENNHMTLLRAIELITNDDISKAQVTQCLNKLMDLPPL